MNPIASLVLKGHTLVVRNYLTASIVLMRPINSLKQKGSRHKNICTSIHHIGLNAFISRQNCDTNAWVFILDCCHKGWDLVGRQAKTGEKNHI